jgi:hypothetical protein
MNVNTGYICLDLEYEEKISHNKYGSKISSTNIKCPIYDESFPVFMRKHVKPETLKLFKDLLDIKCDNKDCYCYLTDTVFNLNDSEVAFLLFLY